MDEKMGFVNMRIDERPTDVFKDEGHFLYAYSPASGGQCSKCGNAAEFWVEGVNPKASRVLWCSRDFWAQFPPAGPIYFGRTEIGKLPDAD